MKNLLTFRHQKAPAEWSDMDHDWIVTCEEAVQLACLTELIAVKPGNVNRYSDHEDTSMMDFILSSVKLAKPLKHWMTHLATAENGIGLGKAVFATVNYLRQTGLERNTNLGIVLVLLPLITATALLRKNRRGLPLLISAWRATGWTCFQVPGSTPRKNLRFPVLWMLPEAESGTWILTG